MRAMARRAAVAWCAQGERDTIRGLAATDALQSAAAPLRQNEGEEQCAENNCCEGDHRNETHDPHIAIESRNRPQGSKPKVCGGEKDVRACLGGGVPNILTSAPFDFVYRAGALEAWTARGRARGLAMSDNLALSDVRKADANHTSRFFLSPIAPSAKTPF